VCVVLNDAEDALRVAVDVGVDGGLNLPEHVLHTHREMSTNPQ
jgi:hypothetical protein